jgi:hypothetical protein
VSFVFQSKSWRCKGFGPSHSPAEARQSFFGAGSAGLET